ncbi:MAG: HD domain-containing protein [Candidatus Woesearchaeota archaeon]
MNKMKAKKLDPIRFTDLAGTLKKIPRTGWLHHGLINVESIAEHSFRTTILAYMLAEDLGCDSSRLIKMALIHDLSETLTGDIVAEHGKCVDIDHRKDKLKKEALALKELSAITPMGDEMYSIWMEYACQKTKEAMLLKQIDKLEMAMQALEYENPKNPNHLKEFWENCKLHINHPLLLGMFKKLCEKRTPPFNSYELIGTRII